MREYLVPAKFSLDPTKTTVDLVLDAKAQAPNETKLLKLVGGDWQPVTAAAFADDVLTAARGLYSQGVRHGDRVAIMSGTRYEWPLLDYAIWAIGAVTVPVYESSSADQLSWILEDSGAVVLIIEGDRQAKEVAALGDALHNVGRVYTIEPRDGEAGALAALAADGTGIDEATLHSERAGVGVDDLATLIYTSGTTGRPKGCELTHRNLLSEVATIQESSIGTELLVPGAKSLFFLPMAHVLARAVSIACYPGGTAVGHYSDTSSVVQQFATFKPDMILSVPRIFEKVYAGARQNAVAGGKEKIFDLAAETAVAYSEALDSGGPGLLLRAKHAVFDRLVYAKLRTALGGQCKASISGGAPLGARLAHFFRGVGVTIYEGYGLTETTAAICVNTPVDIRVGSIGKPLPGQGVRVADDGELLLTGSVVFRGYWKNPSATAEALQDGWFHTGDLGSVDDDGYVFITGRKKELIVTAGGKNVAPAGLEDVIRRDPLVGQAVVIGDQRPFIAALVTIDPDVFPRWKADHGKPESATVADLADDVDLRGTVDAAVQAANATVSHAEAIKKFVILPSDFSEETGELTPTMKVKRHVVTDKYADQIEQLYVKR